MLPRPLQSRQVVIHRMPLAQRLPCVAQRSLDAMTQIFGELGAEIGERALGLVADGVCEFELFRLLAPLLVLFRDRGTVRRRAERCARAQFA
jgi:hypothetical protein